MVWLAPNSQSRLNRLLFACLMVAPSVFFLESEGRGQRNPDDLEKADPNEEITFKPFGVALPIKLEDGNERTLYLLEGKSAGEKSDPATLVFSHRGKTPLDW